MVEFLWSISGKIVVSGNFIILANIDINFLQAKSFLGVFS